MSEIDKHVLSYHDSLLRQSDLRILRTNGWLNDCLIDFYFEYLNRMVIGPERMLCVSPLVTQLFKLSTLTTMLDTAQSLQFTEKDYIFFALNDMSDRLSVGGTHWSLLVVDNRQNVLYHLDSLSDANFDVARSMVNPLSVVLGRDFVLRVLPVYHQENSFDCGIHVLCNAHHLIDSIRTQETNLQLIPPCPINVIREKRSRMLKQIQQLALTHRD